MLSLPRCPEFAWLDGVGLIFYWGACCWSGTDLSTNVKALYYTHHLRVSTREPSVWNHVFTVNIDLFEVARNVCGFVLRNNRRKCRNNSIWAFWGIIKKINVLITSWMIWEYFSFFNCILDTDLYEIMRSLKNNWIISIILTILQCKPLEIYPESSARNRYQSKSAGNSFSNIYHFAISNKIK